MTFYNRTEELAFLAEQARDDRAALVVVYGRRRTGKTALLRHFAKDRRSVLFVADAASRADQLASFAQVAFQALGEPSLEGTTFPSWEAALRFVASRATRQPLFVVLDEFPYLCAAEPSLPSVLQRLWDAELHKTRLHLVLCGSYASFMERDVLGAKNPLYGRRTGEYLLTPLRFRDARLFFHRRTPADQVTAYGILGGIPAYLERFESARSIRDNVVTTVLSRGAPLYNEPRFLLMEELREPQTYFSVCRAVAFGRTTPNEIAQAAGVSDRGIVSRYLETLRELRVLERRTPASERNPERTRRGRYRLADPFFRFWFRFVLPNRSALEAGDPAQVWTSKVAPHLEQHVSSAFEEACEQHLWSLNRGGRLPAEYDRIGGWWRTGDEIDVVAVADGGEVLLGECKWSIRQVGTDVLDALVAKTPAVLEDIPGKQKRVRHALWSRAGFTPELRERARREKVLLFDLASMLGDRT